MGSSNLIFLYNAKLIQAIALIFILLKPLFSLHLWNLFFKIVAQLYFSPERYSAVERTR